MTDHAAHGAILHAVVGMMVLFLYACRHLGRAYRAAVLNELEKAWPSTCSFS